MTAKINRARYWDHVALQHSNRQEFDSYLAEQYRYVHLNLIARWADINTSKSILKTDLFAEALCPSRAFLWDMLKSNSNVIGIDVSTEITRRAKTEAAAYAPNPAEYVNCDVQRLPFTGDSFDLIVSDSSLDHFIHEHEISTALSELTRVLKPGGTLIITMDNKSNFTEPFFRLWIYLGLSPFFIGKTYSMRQLKQALSKTDLQVVDSTAIIHNPRLFTKIGIALLRKLNPGEFDRCIRRGLKFLDSLEYSKTKSLTAQFIAVKAVKTSDKM